MSESLPPSERLRHAPGDLVRLSDRWTAEGTRLLLALFASAVVFLCVGRVTEYAEGSAVIRMSDRTELPAPTDSTVESIDARPGGTVKAGEVLVRFSAARESAELSRVRTEYELQLVQRLARPEDPIPREALTRLSAELQLAEARLAERTLRAPFDGIVSDIRIRPGQHLAAGEAAVSLVRSGADATVVAILPGRYRPQLRVEAPARVTLEGFPDVSIPVTLQSIGTEVVGPAAAARFLGRDVSDAVQFSGAVVIAISDLPHVTFESEGSQYAVHDGMHARVEVPVREERIVFALVPGLRAVGRALR